MSRRQIGFRIGICALVALAAPPAWAQTSDESDPITIMGTAYTGETPPDIALVKQRFIAIHGEDCDWAITGSPEMREPETFDFTFRYSFDEDGDPDRPLKIYRFFCNQGAYNQQHAYFAWTEDGLRPLSFAVPVTVATFTDPGNSDSDVESLTMLGFTTQRTLTNSEIDAETGTILSTSYWRGIGDASSSVTWRLVEGDYVMESYDVDHSYNGKVDPERVVDYSAAAR
ncbi:hypothetical protein SAMN02983003_0928 [Devosia enhydra]|uniref:DUF1176 domain-containing protein n=1 Tax=Devosia enhydra TaxID=665118 RepID=A0A1K2HV65_9HYPH|nr:hypothetical protein [Devosia enhydra]SFZ82187.1 hypothetical protein SAMN02983003_0928 [Devosia enhydra]